MQSHRLWIDGQWVDSQGGGRMAIENPASEQPLAEVADASRADVDRAVQAAKVAFFDGRWSRKTRGERSRVLLKMADLLEARQQEFGRVESENTGKPYQFVTMGADMPFIIDNLRFFAAAARDVHGSHAGEYLSGYTSIFRREPVGVVGQIAPWNYPLMMAVWKFGPALAAGCTVVFKPAPATPLTALMLAELTREAGLPPGVLNIVTGGNQTGQALVEHPDVRMVSLTGSPGTGKRVMETAAKTLKRVHLELGGKAPLLVFDDADLDLVSSKATLGAIFNTGQDCTAATRVYVEKSRLKPLQEALVEGMRQIKVGEPFEEGVQMGPMVSRAQLERVQGFLERATAAGAKVLTGGGKPSDRSAGYYIEPTLFANVDSSMTIAQEEIFGPVLSLIPYDTVDDAIRIANDTIYGLNGAVYTNDNDAAYAVARRVRTGNFAQSGFKLDFTLAFGGFKQSGIGREGGTEGLLPYLETKTVFLNGEPTRA